MHYVILRNFLSAKDCEELIAMANEREFVRSAGFNVDDGESRVSDYRTSFQTWFTVRQNPLITDIENRIADATGTPIENSEGIQIIHYPPGTYYKAHHDYFEPRPGTEGVLANGGQRIITFMIYLNEVPEGEGGETSFFNAYPIFRVRPEQGKACCFFNVMPDFRLDPSTYHEALPTKEPYHKYILNKWIHERVYT